jgi:hypothetical protein
MSEYLLIGPVLLEAFELPARVAWGGRQRLAVHRLPGGRRVIDALAATMPISPGRACSPARMPPPGRAPWT